MKEFVHVLLADRTELCLAGTNARVPQGKPTETTTVVEHQPEGARIAICQDQVTGGRIVTAPFLFEQTGYELTLQTAATDSTERWRLVIGGKDLLPTQAPKGPSGWYSRSLNFGSEVGFTRLELWCGNRILLRLRLEVFPTKIDYREDFNVLRAELHNEARALVFALQGRTHQEWSRRRTGNRPTDIEWLHQLEANFSEMVAAVERIVRIPRERVEVEHHLVSASRPVRATTEARRHLRSRLSECRPTSRNGAFSAHGQRWAPRQLPDERRHVTNDTPENRFVVAALRQTHGKVRDLLARAKLDEATGDWPTFLQQADQKLARLRFRTWLAEIPEPAHGMQPSLALHLAPGYREFLRTWNELSSTIEIGGGPLEMRERDVATLYEMWCFVTLARLLRNEFGLSVRSATWLRIDRKRIDVRLAKGKTSRLEMVDGHGRQFVVSYNPESDTPTGFCYPDNTLEIQQLGTGRRFCYIFDAKYRLATDADYLKVHKSPGPPVDTINRMHAYRDQIVTRECSNLSAHNPASVVWDVGARRWVQSAVGAFVLFPYAGADSARNTFCQAIEKVGVGAVPFLPDRTGEVAELIRRIARHSAETVEDAMVALSTEAERKRIEEAHEYGLLATVPSPENMDYIRSERIYHMPYRSDRQLRLRADFLVFLGSDKKFGKKSGVRSWAKVKSVRFGRRAEIKPSPPPSSGGKEKAEYYVWFELDEVTDLEPPLSYTGHSPQFGVTSRLALNKASDVFDLLLVREPERRLVDELRAAGLIVRVLEAEDHKASPFDIASLRLEIKASLPGGSKDTELTIRFNPLAARFTWKPDGNASWHELMFETESVIDAIQDMLGKTVSTPAG